MDASIEDYLASFDDRDWEQGAEGTVRVACLGLGWWTVDQALPAIEKTDNCETTVLVSSSTEKAERVAAEHGVEVGITYDEFEAGEAADAYDAAYVCTPNATHLDLVEAAAEHGKAVLCEKPMEATVERARDLRDACRAADVPLMIAYRMHTEPAVRRARELVRAGAIGEPVVARGNNTQRVLSIAGPDQWRLDAGLSGYGTSMMDIGIYPLNTARFVMDADPLAVTASMGSYHEAFEDVPDERAACTVAFDNDVHMTITTSQNAHAETSMEVVGTEGRVRLDPAFHGECDLVLETADGSVEIETPAVDEMEEEFAYFADRLLAGAPIGPDGDHGVRDMEALAAAHESAETGRQVALSEV